MNSLSEIDPKQFRTAMSNYASGITVVTAMVDETPVGFTCQSFFSTSLAPPLVSLCVDRKSKSWPRIRTSSGFAINVLTAAQADVSNGFARSDGDRWAGVDWSVSSHGNPVIDNTLLCIECDLHAEHEAGDHMLVLGRVRALVTRDTAADGTPLVFYRGRYLDLGGPALAEGNSGSRTV